MIVYYNGRFLSKSEVRISPDDRGFLFGDGVYDVLCSYDGRPFKAGAHFRRLEHSLREVGMTGSEGDPHEMVVALEAMIPELLRQNDLDARHAKIYLQVTRGAAPRRHAFPNKSVPPTVYATATPYQPPVTGWAEGVGAILYPDRRWARCDIKSISLLPAVLANQHAREAGVYEALLVREGVITEGSHTTVMAVEDDVVITHPINQRILHGITRDVVLALCQERGIAIREEPIRVDTLNNISEMMVLGTTSGVMPVVTVDDRPVGSGEPGPITRQLQRAFLQETNLTLPSHHQHDFPWIG